MVAAILAIARFCEPSSELHIEEKWYRRTALEDLLGVPPEKVQTDRLYAALDPLLPHKEAIEAHLKERFGELFELKCDLLLYDVTSTYLEGDVENCEIAKRATPATHEVTGRRSASAWWSRKKASRWATRSSRATCTIR